MLCGMEVEVVAGWVSVVVVVAVVVERRVVIVMLAVEEEEEVAVAAMVSVGSRKGEGKRVGTKGKWVVGE